MKKIFTLALSSLFVVAAMAADRRPTVTIQSSRNYQIVIDGKSYSTSFGGAMTVPYLSQGYHTIKVYSSMGGRTFFFGRRQKMLDASSFVLRNNDIAIKIDMFGNIQVKELKGWDRDDHDRGRNDRDKDWNQNDRGRDHDGRNF